VTGPTLVLATETGITAALGLVQGARLQALAAEAIVIWLRTAPDYFLPETLLRERVPPACSELRIAATPPIGDPERIAGARHLA
jgi:hypothetical protein